MEQITWLQSLFGGALIGLAASLLLVANGRIAGISGVLANVFSTNKSELWRICFLAGLVLGASVILGFGGLGTTSVLPLGAVVAGGLLVGIGTRMGNGCTSGHGVCGNARLSPRSIVSTLLFMGVGFATVLLLRVEGVIQ